MKDNIKNNEIKDNKIKQTTVLTMQKLLCIFIMLCPILDIISFIFRQKYQTNISISTIIRPLIPIIGFTYIFFKEKIKLPIVLASGIYIVYAICHLFVFSKLETQSSYGNIVREVQYLVNYTFLIMNLVIYVYFFYIKNRQTEIQDKDKGKMINRFKKSILIALSLYILFIYIALITGTSSFTYTEEKIGYKGWFESGNSIGNIMLLAMFVALPMLEKKNENYIRIWSLIIIILVGPYLLTLIGTRTGLFGFIIVILTYAMITILYNLMKNKKISKKGLLYFIITIILIVTLVILLGSRTIQRRKNLENRENEIYDYMRNETSHVTGDILNIVKKIKEGNIDTNYMSKPVQQSILDLYDIANENKISNTNMRILQFIYHSRLIKNQNNIPILLFGNGYMTHFYEMILEMEIPAFLYNFGIVGFFIYFIPFLIVAIYGIHSIIRRIKQVSVEQIMHVLGLCFAIIISFLSGYTFFNSSMMMMIIAITIIILNDIKDLEDNEMKIYYTREEKQ